MRSLGVARASSGSLGPTARAQRLTTRFDGHTHLEWHLFRIAQRMPTAHVVSVHSQFHALQWTQTLWPFTARHPP
eukprot:m.21132 g.21132  ORF g.21132 m.21132 type:complete len:75 (+) comp5656_c0_seq1:808-1032(+)